METDHVFLILVTFGGLFLLGLLADLLGRHTFMPRVTLLIIAGFAVGPSGMDWLPAFTGQWFPVLTDVALAMVGFLLGEKLTGRSLRRLGRPVLYMSVGEVVVTALLMTVVLALCGVPLEIALLLGGIAPATAPAATVDTVDAVAAKGKFTDTLLGIVAVDDAWGLIIFSILLAAAQMVSGNGFAADVLMVGLWQMLGALGLGVAIGLPMAFLTGRLRAGEPTQAEALGFILICAGLSVWANVSHILAAMALGTTVANRAKHHQRPFHEIKGIEWPFLILFFMLAGARLEIDALLQVGYIGVGYVVLRVVGQIVGTAAAGRLISVEPQTRRWLGVALMPQAGVAMGMALLAVQMFPQHQDVVLPVVLGATVVFELAGPVATRWVLVHVGEAGAAAQGNGAQPVKAPDSEW
jgi:Kef-type K+ transport system membrane component KefB